MVTKWYQEVVWILLEGAVLSLLMVEGYLADDAIDTLHVLSAGFNHRCSVVPSHSLRTGQTADASPAALKRVVWAASPQYWPISRQRPDHRQTVTEDSGHSHGTHWVQTGPDGAQNCSCVFSLRSSERNW